jgi:hypothetical protein
MVGISAPMDMIPSPVGMVLLAPAQAEQPGLQHLETVVATTA